MFKIRFEVNCSKGTYIRSLFNDIASDTDNMSYGAMKDFKQLNGKELSYNNIRDMDLAWKVVSDFDEICCKSGIIKSSGI